MRSALPSHHSGSPSLSNDITRECSRKRPTIERTRMVSDRPGTPGRSEQMPRISSSTGTPAADASYSASMIRSSTSELSLNRMPDGLPSAACRASRRIFSISPVRMPCGATISIR